MTAPPPIAPVCVLDGRDSVAAGVAHDVNAALQVARGYVRVALKACGDMPDVARDLDAAVVATDRAAAAATRLLQFARGRESVEDVEELGTSLDWLVTLLDAAAGPGVATVSGRSGEGVSVRGADAALRRAVLLWCLSHVYMAAPEPQFQLEADNQDGEACLAVFAAGPTTEAAPALGDAVHRLAERVGGRAEVTHDGAEAILRVWLPAGPAAEDCVITNRDDHAAGRSLGPWSRA